MAISIFIVTIATLTVACEEGGEADGDIDADTDVDSDSDADIDGDGDMDADADADADSDGEADADADSVGDADGDADRDCDFAWALAGIDPFIDEVVEFSPAEGTTFGASELPEIVFGPPFGGSAGAGAHDVVSLGCGGSITVRFDAPIIFDGPGDDFIVFENPFVTGDTVFAEPAQVSVSVDGDTFVPFPCDPTTLVGCAGQEPVLSAPDNCLDPTDPSVAGGDAFDLADVGLSEVVYVRFEDRSEENPDSAVWCGGESSGFDLDAMAVVIRD